MTWKEFIEAAEAAGVKATDVLAFVDWQPGMQNWLRIEVLPSAEDDPPNSRRIAIT